MCCQSIHRESLSSIATSRLGPEKCKESHKDHEISNCFSGLFSCERIFKVHEIILLQLWREKIGDNFLLVMSYCLRHVSESGNLFLAPKSLADRTAPGNVFYLVNLFTWCGQELDLEKLGPVNPWGLARTSPYRSLSLCCVSLTLESIYSFAINILLIQSVPSVSDPSQEEVFPEMRTISSFHSLPRMTSSFMLTVSVENSSNLRAAFAGCVSAGTDMSLIFIQY